MTYLLPCICFLVISSATVLEEIDYCMEKYEKLCHGKGMHVGCQFIDEWDRELAFLAQKLADECEFVHDNCRATVRYPFAGQTVGEVRHRSGAPDNVKREIRRLFDAWWDEKKRAEVLDIVSPFKLPFRGGAWGHFTQLAVWNLRALGCGGVRHGRNSSNFLLICDFSHTNMLGQKTIDPGAMKQCPMHMKRSKLQYPSLCAPEQNDDDYSHHDDEQGRHEDGHDHHAHLEATHDGGRSQSVNQKTVTHMPTSLFKVEEHDASKYKEQKSQHDRNEAIRQREKFFRKKTKPEPSIRRPLTSNSGSRYSVYTKQFAYIDREHGPKWIQIVKPRPRPEATALPRANVKEIEVLERRPSKTLQHLDDDVRIQLYNDTGFNLNLKN